MDYPPSHGNLSTQNLAKGLCAGIDTLYRRLSALDLDAISISEYNRDYIRTYREDLSLTLRRYAQLIGWSFEEASTTLESVVFLDYGGGTGIMSMLAKAAGVGTVIYNDIYDVSCSDARTLATEVELVADHYVQGEVADVAMFLREEGLEIDAVASFDVIEHIYDISGFFFALQGLTQGPMSIVMSTSANPYNPLVARNLRQVHYEAEYLNREKEPGSKERDSLGSYFSIRRMMIREMGADLNDLTVEQLAKATRGLYEPDIRIAVSDYQTTGRMPSPCHPTNTCDPLTGNWAEKLMDLCELRDQLRSAGYRAELRSGLYEETGTPIRQYLKRILNRALPYVGETGRFFAPSIVIYGRRD